MNALSLLRRRAAVCALLAALCAAFAAPYLVPADPDAAVFRVGALGTLLILAAAFPAKRALERHSARALAYGFAFALCFSLCLGVGSELVFYDGFLRGLGSALRRVAVPALVSPLLGALASYLFAFRPEGGARRLNLPFLAYFLLLLACYGAALLAFYPGILNYDFEFEIAQFLSGSFDAKHPVFHTLLLGALYRLGQALTGTPTGGALCYSAVQIALLAAMYAAACVFVQKRLPALATALLALCFALLPFHAVIVVSTVKDALFSGLCLLLCLQLWRIAEDPDAFLGSRAQIARFALCCLAAALIRLNGIFALLPACLALPALCRRGTRRRAAALAAATLVLSVAAPRGLEAAVHAEKAPASEMLSVPCQQMMRTAVYADLGEEEREELSAWFSGTTDRYRPTYADPAKGGNFDYARYARDPSEFWSAYGEYARRFPTIYAEAFLFNCLGLWYPDDESHAHTMDSEDWDFVYLKTGNIVPDVLGEVDAHSYLPKLRQALESSAHSASHERIPLLSLLFRPSSYSFLLLLSTLLLLCKRRRAAAAALLPVWGVALSLAFSACILVRYAYPIMSAMPVLFALALFAGGKEEKIIQNSN